ncbi:hypothetical protein ACOJB1_12605 [Enterococcus innesii]|uniref:hypothetical protein n=1 Tax=Enterococcus innesii TaxID=2839759 RepID=UPI003B590894
MNIDADKVISSLAVKLANAEVQSVKYEILANQLQESLAEVQRRNAELEEEISQITTATGAVLIEEEG